MIRVALIATVHCDHAGPGGTVCRRFDEYDERPTPEKAGSAQYRLHRAAYETFDRRGWTFAPGGKAYCSDHAPPKPTPRKGARP
jgi:hypothetical protein